MQHLTDLWDALAPKLGTDVAHPSFTPGQKLHASQLFEMNNIDNFIQLAADAMVKAKGKLTATDVQDLVRELTGTGALPTDVYYGIRAWADANPGSFAPDGQEAMTQFVREDAFKRLCHDPVTYMDIGPVPPACAWSVTDKYKPSTWADVSYAPLAQGGDFGLSSPTTNKQGPLSDCEEVSVNNAMISVNDGRGRAWLESFIKPQPDGTYQASFNVPQGSGDKAAEVPVTFAGLIPKMTDGRPLTVWTSGPRDTLAQVYEGLEADFRGGYGVLNDSVQEEDLFHELGLDPTSVQLFQDTPPQALWDWAKKLYENHHVMTVATYSLDANGDPPSVDYIGVGFPYEHVYAVTNVFRVEASDIQKDATGQLVCQFAGAPRKVLSEDKDKQTVTLQMDDGNQFTYQLGQPYLSVQNPWGMDSGPNKFPQFIYDPTKFPTPIALNTNGTGRFDITAENFVKYFCEMTEAHVPNPGTN
jgi:hypothetical protein